MILVIRLDVLGKGIGSLMPRSKEQLKEDIRRLEQARVETEAALLNVRDLLAKADERRVIEGERRWNRILDNLEHTLDFTRSKLTACEQDLKRAQRELEALENNEPVAAPQAPSADKLRGPAVVMDDGEVINLDHPFSGDYLQTADLILSMPLEALRSLTLDEVAAMHKKLVQEEPEESFDGDLPPPPPEPEMEPSPTPLPSETVKHSFLEERIARAMQAKQAREAATRRQGQSFAERRRLKRLRDAVTKTSSGQIRALDLDEIDLVLACHQSVSSRREPTDSDQRLMSLIAPHIDALRQRAADLRKKRAQSYLRH